MDFKDCRRDLCIRFGNLILNGRVIILLGLILGKLRPGTFLQLTLYDQLILVCNIKPLLNPL